MKKLTLILIVLFIGVNCSVSAQRSTETLNSGWRFNKGDAFGAERIGYDDSAWKSVNLPHTWNTDAYTIKDYYRGIGWYRKKVFVPNDKTEKQLFLKFEGVNAAAEVYINGKSAGKHFGGYTAFTIDATAFLKIGDSNIISVKADNSKLDIPPLSGDFSIFGGIYRDVWLIATEKQHIDMLNAGSKGVFVETPSVSEQSANVLIRGAIKNESDAKTAVVIENVIVAPDGSIVQTLNTKVTLNKSENTPFSIRSKDIPKPLLWSPDSPHLYEIRTSVRDAKTNKLLDYITSPLGFRWFKFGGSEGFSLNGKPLKLIGVCRHQDQKGIGNALTDEMHRRDMTLIKEMGANFIRISHYPQDDAILEQCDKLGILAWEEIPVVDIVSLDKSFEDVCHANLKEMIRQHYNHPSIIMWGYMNEPVLVTTRTLKGDDLKVRLAKTTEIARNLEVTLRAEDPVRASAIAFHASEIYHEMGLSAVTDIVGWNIYRGWYSGNIAGFDEFMKKQNDEHPSHNLIVSEYGAGSDKRLHSLNPESFDFSMEHQQAYHEHYLPVISKEKYITGATVWNFIDFGSANRDESMPRINNKGLVYSDRTPKDVYYYYQAFLRKDIPVLRIASNDWAHRAGIQSGNRPVVQPVKVYSNLPEVELFMDGVSQGRKTIRNFNAVWDIAFTGGKKHFTAKGIYAGKGVEDAVDVYFEAIPDVLTEKNTEQLELGVNVGSNCFFTGQESQFTWLADKEYTSGSWGYIGGDVYRTSDVKVGTQTQIKNTVDNPLFQTLRTDIRGYRFDVPNGVYELELLFADVFAASAKVAHNLGDEAVVKDRENVFDVYLNGEPLIERLNVASEYGHFDAVKKKFEIIVSDNKGISLTFKAVDGKTFLNGIKIRKK